MLIFKRHLHKMVKHTQTIHRQKPMKCLSVFDHFMRLSLKGHSELEVFEPHQYLIFYPKE